MPFLSQIQEAVVAAFKAEVTEDLTHLANIAALQLKNKLKEYSNIAEGQELISVTNDICSITHATYFGMLVGRAVLDDTTTFKAHSFVCTETKGKQIAEDLVYLSQSEVQNKLEAEQYSNALAHIPK